MLSWMVRALIAALIAMLVAPSSLATRAQETESETSKSVNVEFILDVSGSMAQVLDTGETRIDAAKRVMSAVIAAIPERKGVNVGLRVYGIGGDNTEAGKPESCKSSKLVVPLKGVDKTSIQGEIDNLQPTGWTPIALSLSRADKDFKESGKDVTNAIVLITDGLETCGGNPAAVAKRLHGYKRAITTNVVGFALTDEEQQTLGAIAKNGKGLLLGAGNAEELSTALFSVLQKLEIVAGPGFVGGNAFSLLPAGESGEVGIVATGQVSQFGSLAFVLRNNTAEDIEDVKVSATARDSSGALVGAADAIYFNPHTVVAGGVAFGAVYFGDVTLPADVAFEFDVESSPAGSNRFNIYRDLAVVEASLFEDRIVGQVQNSTKDAINGPIILSVVCFDANGVLLGQLLDTIDTKSIAPGDKKPFQVNLGPGLYQFGSCPVFLVAGAGLKS